MYNSNKAKIKKSGDIRVIDGVSDHNHIDKSLPSICTKHSRAKILVSSIAGAFAGASDDRYNQGKPQEGEKRHVLEEYDAPMVVGIKGTLKPVTKST